MAIKWCANCGRLTNRPEEGKDKGKCPECEEKLTRLGKLKKQIYLKVLKKKSSSPIRPKRKIVKSIKHPLPNKFSEPEDRVVDIIDIIGTEPVRLTEQELEIILTSDVKRQTTQRQGQDSVREQTLQNYDYQCAFCDVTDNKLLVASHISRWADDPEARGNLSNVICLCVFHDFLFEHGYLSLSDDYKVLKKSDTTQAINLLLKLADKFRLPKANYPESEFLQKHRLRTGFE